MSAVEILREARALIGDKSRWTQGECARDAEGKSVFSSSAKAVCFCAAGALNRVSPDELRIDVGERLNRSAEALFGIDDYVEINDTPITGHNDILKVFDKAIAEAEAANA